MESSSSTYPMLSQGIGAELAKAGTTTREKAVVGSSLPAQGQHTHGASIGQRDDTWHTAGGRHVPFPNAYISKQSLFLNWGKMRKMPLSLTLSPQTTFGQEPGWELAPASVMLFCYRTQGLAEDAACQTRTEFVYLYPALAV